MILLFKLIKINTLHTNKILKAYSAIIVSFKHKTIYNQLLLFSKTRYQKNIFWIFRKKIYFAFINSNLKLQFSITK